MAAAAFSFFLGSVAAPRPLLPEGPEEGRKEGGREAVEVGLGGQSQGLLHSEGAMLPALSGGTPP